MKLKILSILICTILLTGCAFSKRERTPRSEEFTEYASFIDLEMLTDTIARDRQTDVLYVRETHETYGASLKVITTFPIMEADGTCLTYTEWKNRRR